MRSLVSALQAEPARPRSDDGRARTGLGPHNNHALGAAFRARVREALESIRPPVRSIVARRRDVCEDPRQVDIPVPGSRSRGTHCGFPPEREPRCQGGQGVLSQGAGDSRPSSGDTLDGYAASHRAVRELPAQSARWKATRLRSSKYLTDAIDKKFRHLPSWKTVFVCRAVGLSRLQRSVGTLVPPNRARRVPCRAPPAGCSRLPARACCHRGATHGRPSIRGCAASIEGALVSSRRSPHFSSACARPERRACARWRPRRPVCLA